MILTPKLVGATLSGLMTLFIGAGIPFYQMHVSDQKALAAEHAQAVAAQIANAKAEQREHDEMRGAIKELNAHVAFIDQTLPGRERRYVTAMFAKMAAQQELGVIKMELGPRGYFDQKSMGNCLADGTCIQPVAADMPAAVPAERGPQ